MSNHEISGFPGGHRKILQIVILKMIVLNWSEMNIQEHSFKFVKVYCHAHHAYVLFHERKTLVSILWNFFYDFFFHVFHVHESQLYFVTDGLIVSFKMKKWNIILKVFQFYEISIMSEGIMDP